MTKKNKAKPDITITLDKQRTLRFDLNAMCLFEEVAGKSLFDASFQLATMTAKDLRAMLWACLQYDDPEITLEQVGALISAENMTDVAARLNQAFDVAMPDERTSDRPLPSSPG